MKQKKSHMNVVNVALSFIKANVFCPSIVCWHRQPYNSKNKVIISITTSVDITLWRYGSLYILPVLLLYTQRM